MSSNTALPKGHAKQPSGLFKVVKQQINNVGGAPKRPPPVPGGNGSQNNGIPVPVSPIPIDLAAVPKYQFKPIDMDDLFDNLTDELNDLSIPTFGQKDDKQPTNQNIEDDVVSEGLTPRAPEGNESPDNSRSNSTSTVSTMGDTHNSVGSGSPRHNGEMSPRKLTMPTNKIIDSMASSAIRSASDSGPGFKTGLGDTAKEKRFNSTPVSKPEVPKPNITITSRGEFPSSPRSPLPVNPGTQNTPSPPPVNQAKGPSSLSSVPFGLDSYTGSDTFGSPARTNPLSQSTGSIPKQASPGTPKRKVHRVEDGLIIVSKNFVPTVKGGVLDKIIDYLVRQPSRDSDSTNAFLLNYRKYIEPTQLLAILFTKLSNSMHESSSSSDQVALRCLNLIQYWVSSHYHDFAEDHELLSDLQERLTSLKDERVNPIRNTIAKQEAKYRSLLAKPPMTLVNVNAKKVNMLDLKPAIVSQQLCLFEHELFRAIHPKEFLNQNWEKHKEKAPNICRMVLWFNTVADWIGGQILMASSTKEREKLTKFWIEVADQCRINNNFNAVQEIMSAFTGNAVYRLKPLWEKINKSKKTSTLLETLRNLVDASFSYKTYRESLKNVVGACIPFMSLILKDLIYIEDGNPNILPIEGRSDIINFDKAMRISAIIGHQSPSILGFQTELYKFPKVEAVYNIFNNGLSVLSDEERHQLSLKIMPRKTAK